MLAVSIHSTATPPDDAQEGGLSAHARVGLTDADAQLVTLIPPSLFFIKVR